MSLAKSATKIGKLSTIYLVGSITPQVINMLVLPIYTDYLSKEQMGVVNLAARLSVPLAIVIQLGALAGFKSWFFRTDPPLRPQFVRTMQLSQLGINAAVVGILALTGLVASQWILPGLPYSATAVYVLWLLILADAFGDASTKLATMVMRLMEHAKQSVTLNFAWYILQTTVSLSVVFMLARRGLDEWQGFGRQASSTVAALITAVAAAAIVWRYGGGRYDPHMARQTLRTGVTFVPHQLSDGLMLTANAWMVNGLFSTAALGVYGIAISFAQIIQLAIFNFSDAAYPTLSNLMRQGGAESRRKQARIYTLTLLILIVVLLGQQLFATVGIRVLTNPAFHEAAAIVPILILAWTFQAFYMIVVQPVFFFGGGFWLSCATFASIVVSIGLGAWTIPEFGVYGAAWSVVAGFVSRFIVAFAASTYLYPLPWEITKLARALACAALIVWIDGTFVDGWLVVVKDLGRPGGFFERVEWINLVVMSSVKLLLLASMVPLLWGVGAVTSRELKMFADAVRGKLKATFGR